MTIDDGSSARVANVDLLTKGLETVQLLIESNESSLAVEHIMELNALYLDADKFDREDLFMASVGYLVNLVRLMDNGAFMEEATDELL